MTTTVLSIEPEPRVDIFEHLRRSINVITSFDVSLSGEDALPGFSLALFRFR